MFTCHFLLSACSSAVWWRASTQHQTHYCKLFFQSQFRDSWNINVCVTLKDDQHSFAAFSWETYCALLLLKLDQILKWQPTENAFDYHTLKRRKLLHTIRTLLRKQHFSHRPLSGIELWKNIILEPQNKPKRSQTTNSWVIYAFNNW